MTTREAALELGISTRALGNVLKKSGLRMRLSRQGNQYLLSPENVREVVDYQQKQKADRAFDRALKANVEQESTRDDDGYWIDGIDLRKSSPALPLEYLADIEAHWDQFYAERRRRELRLLALIRASGLKLGPRAHIPQALDIDDLDGIEPGSEGDADACAC